MANKDASEIQIHFICERCGYYVTCNVSEAVYGGPPVCRDCIEEEDMCLDHCFVED